MHRVLQAVGGDKSNQTMTAIVEQGAIVLRAAQWADVRDVAPEEPLQSQIRGLSSAIRVSLPVVDGEVDKDTAPGDKDRLECLRRNIKEVIITATAKLRKGVVMVVGRLVQKAKQATDVLIRIAGGAPSGGRWYDTALVTVDILDHFELTLKLTSKKQLNNSMTAVEEALFVTRAVWFI